MQEVPPLSAEEVAVVMGHLKQLLSKSPRNEVAKHLFPFKWPENEAEHVLRQNNLSELRTKLDSEWQEEGYISTDSLKTINLEQKLIAFVASWAQQCIDDINAFQILKTNEKKSDANEGRGQKGPFIYL